MGVAINQSLGQINSLAPGALTGQGVEHAAPAMAARNLIIPHIHAPLSNTAQTLAANTNVVPDAATITVTSNNGMGAGDKTVYLLNQSDYNDIDDNGSGAASITYGYQDGFAGRLLSNALAFARAGVGAILYGFSIRLFTGGAGNPSGLAATNPFLVYYNTFGRTLNTDVSSTYSQTRSDFDDSIMVWQCVGNVGKFMQFGFTIPANSVATVTLYFTASFKI